MVTTLIREEKTQYEASRVVDQDGLWKKVIGDLFEDFLLFFASELHEHIDFSQEPDFLDKELFQEVVDEQKGRRFADRLVKVRLKNGEEKWILIHIEVQSKNEAEFPERMFQYFYRIYDRHREKVVAIAVHTAPNQSNILQHFEYDYFGTQLHYSYTNNRTEDYSDEELERSDKLFSKIVLAMKALHKTKDEEHQRYLFKRKLMREIVRNKNYSRAAVQAVLHFIDYLLQLPEEYMRQLSNYIGPIIRKETKLMELYNKENASPTILKSFAEELEEGVKQGKMQGKIEGMLEGKLEERLEIAQKLIIEQLSLERISAITGLGLAQVKEIQKSIK